MKSINRMNRIIRIVAIISLAAWAASVTTGCANNKDASTRAMRSQADGLRNTLAETQDQLRAVESERDELAVANRELAEQMAQLEEHSRQQLAQVQALRDSDAALAAKHIRDLTADVNALRAEIERRETEKQALQSTIQDQNGSIRHLETSLETQRNQVAKLESEKSALAEQLKATKRSRAKLATIMGIMLVGSVVTTFVFRSRRVSEARMTGRSASLRSGVGSAGMAG